MPHLSEDGEGRIAILAVCEMFVYLPGGKQNNGGNEGALYHGDAFIYFPQTLTSKTGSGGYL
jgi:hypothetical protein